MTIRTLSLTSIRIDGDTQPRETISNDVVAEYRDAMKAGVKFPPLVVFFDGEDYWLADGFHRYEAASDLGLNAIRAEVHRGSKRDAKLFACGANSAHGLRRTNADKRRAVLNLLSDPEWSQWSDTRIAKQCAVSQPFVSDLRRSLASQKRFEMRERRVERGGTVYTLDTANIGKRASGDEAPHTSPTFGDALGALAEIKKQHPRREQVNPYADDPAVMWLPDQPEPHWLTRAVAALGSARFVSQACNRKLGPVTTTPGRERPHVVALPPFVAVTYASIEGTCPRTCVFKGHGCYAEAGPEKFHTPVLDPDVTPSDVIAEEVRLIDAFDPSADRRDLRLHDCGDAPTEECAWMLAGAAKRWRERGGGSIWTYSHAWREVPREAWGTISVLASVEKAEDIEAARQRGYPAALVVERFLSEKAFRLPGTTARIVPCPAETRVKKTCVECRLCLDRDLLHMNRAIAFKVHGQGEAEALAQLRNVNRKEKP